MNIVDCFGTDGAELYIFFLSVSAPSVPNYIYIYISGGRRRRRERRRRRKTMEETMEKRRKNHNGNHTFINFFQALICESRTFTTLYLGGCRPPDPPRAPTARCSHLRCENARQVREEGEDGGSGSSGR